MSIYQSTKISPYVYWLIHKETGQFYIGYREANIVSSDQDLCIIYFTSSKKIKELGFENFNFKVLAEFFDGDSGYNFENRLIEEHIKNPLCLNESYTKEGSRKFSFSGKHHRLDSKEKVSKARTGKFKSTETKENMSIAKQKSYKEKGKIPNNKDRKHSEQSKLNMKLAVNPRHSNKNHSIEAKLKISTSLLKTWIIINEKDNSQYEIHNLQQWCEEHDIKYHTFYKSMCCNKFHKGYKLIKKTL